jgi:hypothetical protein
MNSVFSRWMASSWSASTIQVGTLIALRSLAVQFGCVSHILPISAKKLLNCPGVADSASYSFSARAVNSLNTGLVPTSFTPLGSELAAKAKSRETRSGWLIARLNPRMAPSLQPTIAAWAMPR